MCGADLSDMDDESHQKKNGSYGGSKKDDSKKDDSKKREKIGSFDPSHPHA